MKIETTLTLLVFEEPPQGVILQENYANAQRDFGSEAFVQVVYTLGFGVPASILSAWLWERIKKHKDKPEFRIFVNTKEIIEITEESFKRTIEQELEIEVKGKK